MNISVPSWPHRVCIVMLLVLASCTLAPAGLDNQQAKLSNEKGFYGEAFSSRALPSLPQQPTWQDVLQRAFLANGDLEASYHDWAAAVARVRGAGAFPNVPLQVNFQYLLSSGQMKSWDRTTVSIQPNPMDNLALPPKIYKSAEVALHDAEAAGERFRAAKFALQQTVLTAWANYGLSAEQLRIENDNTALLRLLVQSLTQQTQTGGKQQDLLRLNLELSRSENKARNLATAVDQQRAALNALLGLPASSPLAPPERMPDPRPAPNAELLLAHYGPSQSPQLQALLAETQGRESALDLARMQFLPDLMPTFSFTGSVSQIIGGGLSLGASIPKIRASIEEAKHQRDATLAVYRQQQHTTGAQFVGAVYRYANAERQISWFEKEILPLSANLQEVAEQAYISGQGSLLEFIESERAVLEAREQSAEVKAEREIALGEIEAIVGADVESLRLDHSKEGAPQ